ncbi:MAG: Hsp20/alpha crystallin family protein [Massilia sp.]|uniref:Hsp20/alpha crystallin family protein n=1 Tax=Massilia sp. TaxID=1882437 RepID=UPI002FCCA52A
MENQVINQVQTSETGAAMTSAQPVSPRAATTAVATTDAVSHAVIAAAAPIPMGKQAQRQQAHGKFVTVRCEIESQVNAAVNAQRGRRYKGTFELHIDTPKEVTVKTISACGSSGVLFFTPDKIDEHPELKKIRKVADGFNLSALMSRAKPPANIDDASWQVLEEMCNDVSTVLRTHGLAPMQALITRALAEKGLGGPKISKKLGGGMTGKAGDKHEVMCQVLDHMNELLAQNVAAK